MSTTAAAVSASPPTAASPSTDRNPSHNHIHTYHCLCTQLLLATTTPLPALPRRGATTSTTTTDTTTPTTTTPLDRAYILPLPAPPSTTAQPPESSATTATPTSPHYALTLSLTTDRAPLVVQRDDGLEKRYLARCGRCRVVVGYWLDWSQFAAPASARPAGRREDVVYLLPGGLLATEDMARGGGRGGRKGGEGLGV